MPSKAATTARQRFRKIKTYSRSSKGVLPLPVAARAARMLSCGSSHGSLLRAGMPVADGRLESHEGCVSRRCGVIFLLSPLGRTGWSAAVALDRGPVRSRRPGRCPGSPYGRSVGGHSRAGGRPWGDLRNDRSGDDSSQPPQTGESPTMGVQCAFLILVLSPPGQERPTPRFYGTCFAVSSLLAERASCPWIEASLQRSPRATAPRLPRRGAVRKLERILGLVAIRSRSRSRVGPLEVGPIASNGESVPVVPVAAPWSSSVSSGCGVGGRRAAPSVFRDNTAQNSVTTETRAFRGLLGLLILSVLVSPRLRIGAMGEQAIDLRLQDFLLAVALVYLFAAPRSSRLRPMRVLWGDALLIFCLVAFVGFLLHSLSPEYSALRGFAFFGRALEAFVLASVVCRLMLAAGRAGARTAFRAIHLGAVANFVWVLFQAATGQSTTLLGDIYDSGTYGPRLLGEPSVFGAGVFFVFIAALGVAEFRSRAYSRIWASALVTMGCAGAMLAQSRVSLIAVLIFIGLGALKTGYDRAANPLRLALAGGFVAGILLLVRADIYSRFSQTDLAAGLAIRQSRIWAPIVEVIRDSFWWGIGPGALGTMDYPWSEAHNIVLRALLDYGVLGALAFFWLFLSGGYRASRFARTTASVAGRTFGGAAVLFLGALLIAGMVQEALTAVMSLHLLMVLFGLTGAHIIFDEEARMRRGAVPEASRPIGTAPR